MDPRLSVYKEFTLFGIATLAFSWIFWIPSAILFSEAELTSDLFTSPLFIILQTLGAAGPSVVGYLILKIYYPDSAVKKILDRYKRWRLEMRWYGYSILLVVSVSLAALLLNELLFEPALKEGHPLYDMYRDIGPAVLAVLPLVFVAQVFTSPLLEEFGWRGYAQPLLQRKWGVLGSSAAVGSVWAVWHLPLIVAYGHSVPLNLLSIICYSILMGWILNATGGSMIMMLLFHASLNVGINVIAPGHDSVILFLLTLAVTAIVVYHLAGKGLKPFNRESGYRDVTDEDRTASVRGNK